MSLAPPQPSPDVTPFWSLLAESGDEVTISIWRPLADGPGFVHVVTSAADGETDHGQSIIELTPPEAAQVTYALARAVREVTA